MWAGWLDDCTVGWMEGIYSAWLDELLDELLIHEKVGWLTGDQPACMDGFSAATSSQIDRSVIAKTCTGRVSLCKNQTVGRTAACPPCLSAQEGNLWLTIYKREHLL